jgi:protein-L-isoaspartate(D-aspartate) O-methyltransferase
MKEAEFAKQRSALVEGLVRAGALTDQRYASAMLRVRRELFVWKGYEDRAYANTCLPLGDTGQSITAPEMCASMIDVLGPCVGESVLEVGSGSGYHAAVLAESVAATGSDQATWGRVTTIEKSALLWRFAKDNLKRAGYADRVLCLQGDGSLGYPPRSVEERYERILVTAAAPSPPRSLVEQLRRGGVMVIPIGDKESQKMTMIAKGEQGELEEIPFIGCSFVPLVGENGWPDEQTQASG